MRGVLSIDIGYKNLGYTLMTYDENPSTFDKFNIEFDIFNITEHKSSANNVVASRCQALQDFFVYISDRCVLEYVIIEKQVPTNTKAMELMYAIYAISLFYCGTSNIILFDPKMKFTSINEIYTTEKKAHKKQSIVYAEQLVRKKFPDRLDSFKHHPKQDDIADSLNQLIIWLISSNILLISFSDLRKIYGLN